MVDLVKIRKKARKDAEARDAEPQPAREAESAPPLAATEKASTEPSKRSSSAPPPEPSVPAEAKEPMVTEQAPATAGAQESPASIAPSPESGAPPVSMSKLDRFKQEAGSKRDFGGSLAAEQQAPAGESNEVLTFVISGENYALPIEKIVEIVTAKSITRIPNAEEAIVGIMSLRGTIVTLLDVRRKLRHAEPSGPEEDRRIVVVEFGGETVGFEVDRVQRVVKVDVAAIEPHPVVHSSEHDSAIRGVFRNGDALTILLDLDKLLATRGVSLPAA